MQAHQMEKQDRIRVSGCAGRWCVDDSYPDDHSLIIEIECSTAYVKFNADIDLSQLADAFSRFSSTPKDHVELLGAAETNTVSLCHHKNLNAYFLRVGGGFVIIPFTQEDLQDLSVAFREIQDENEEI